MSKGNGHSSSCTCNWCSQNFYGQNSGGVRISVSELSRGSVNLGFFNPYENEYESYKKTYVNPNAKCPVCGESVYFCQLENDGRVFFDELAPFWTKHPCTDKSQNAENKKIHLKKLIIYDQKSDFEHLSIQSEKEGWQPFKLKSIDVLDSGFDRIEGLFDSKKIELFSNHYGVQLSLYNALNMQFASLTKDELPSIQVKRIGKHLFKISTFFFDKDLNVITKEYKAFNKLGIAYNAYKKAESYRKTNKTNNKTKTPNKTSPILTKKEITKNKTAFELAFEKAQSQSKKL